jgi:hypothetical protein
VFDAGCLMRLLLAVRHGREPSPKPAEQSASSISRTRSEYLRAFGFLTDMQG